MHPERQQFLSLRDKPCRITRQEAAWTLGLQESDIAILVRGRALKPLGNPAPNGEKFFSYHQLAELGKDQAWLDRATKMISQYHRQRNQKVPVDDAASAQSSAGLPRSLPARAA